ncbi:MAG: acyl carrier protein [Candidatus Midichloria sp.]|uniref:Acyl carrier protein n=1 Tax=Hyalomma marginatum TaxID=34627 RepID=A0A8S4C3B3_9ACAR|nr:acyl carrier protein [Hyalomma marginatum]CAG7598113.1 acyl carrier protein [Hyalomma marginatum]
MSSDIKAKVIEAITKSLKPEDPKKVTLGAKLVEDLKADSLDIVELIMALEKDFEIDITDEAAKNIKTVQDAVSYIEAQLSNQSSQENPPKPREGQPKSKEDQPKPKDNQAKKVD